MAFDFEKLSSSLKDQEIKKKTEQLNKSGRFKFGEDQVKEVEEWEKKKQNSSQVKSRTKKKFDQSRRFFIMSSIVGAAGVCLTQVDKSPLGKLIKYFSNEERVDKKIEEDVVTEKEAEVVMEKEEIEEAKLEEKAEHEQQEISRDNVRSIKELLDFNKPGPIKITEKHIEQLKDSWKEKYKTDHRYKNSLEYAYYEMGAWKDDLQKEFRDVFVGTEVPKEVVDKLMYLAIPESHWKFRAKSNKGAQGPYQFVTETAHSYGLKTGRYKGEHWNIDERRDPIKSAHACARLLKDLYKATGDMNMALSGYNGGFIWHYLKDIIKNNKSAKKESEKKEVSYGGFLKYLEGKVNFERDRVKKLKDFPHKIGTKWRKGKKVPETLSDIAGKYMLSVSGLQLYNGIVDAN
ncbi:transglycosylase SLT domain-containing protein, partial [bacterium]|nr:transglycosylase SLT domain-containing protein [bacterium]